MKEIKSRVQPNHRECQIWVDLNEDPHGSIKKYWNGEQWVEILDKNVSLLKSEIKYIKEQIVSLFAILADLKDNVDSVKNYDDTKVHERINKLIKRVNKLEQCVPTK